MKPIWMIFVGASCEGHVEAGKRYKIVEKEREEPMYPGGKVWYTYFFIDDAGNKEPAASHLFLPMKKRKMGMAA